MVTDEMVEKAIDKAVASLIDEHPMGHWRGDQVKEVARRAIAEAVLSAAEPVAYMWQDTSNGQGYDTKFSEYPPAPSPYISGEITPLYAASTAPSVAVKALQMADETFRDLGWHDKYEATTAALTALSAQVQDVAEGWHVSSNSGSILIYCLKQDGWRKGDPVMVNDIMIRVENANRSSHELQPIVDAIMRALPAAPAKQEGGTNE